MKFGMHWRSWFSRPTAPSGGPPVSERAPAVDCRCARLTIALLDLLGAWLIFLIRYQDPLFPYLILAVLVAALWRLRAGALCLAASLAVMTLILLRDPSPAWHERLQDLLPLALAGLVCLGLRAVLDGVERQRRTERRLNAELSETVAQLRESERQQALASQSLAERHHLLRAILDAVDNGIFLVDPEGRIGFANERLGELLGLKVRDLIGQDAGAAILAPLAARCRDGSAPRAAPLAGGPPEISRHLIELVRPAPRLLCQYRAPIRADAGTLLGCLYVYSDLPDRDRLQELLEVSVAERTRELQAAHEQLLRAERLAALGQFSATMAHELRNPLNVVKLSAHYITTRIPDQDEKLRRSVSHLNRQMDRACDIINDLLQFSRLPAPQPQPAAVNEIVREAIMALPIPDAVTVELALAPDLPPVMADPRQIEQAVQNIGLNALQAMPDGGCLTVGTHEAGDHVAITVCDTGPGVPDELRARVFEPFFSTKVTGTGLGLPLVREIAVAHGGNLALQDAPGQGACFTLALPLATSE